MKKSQDGAGSPEKRYNRALAYDRRFVYLRAEDRYVSMPPAPRFRLALIGCGLMGQMHIAAVYAEGQSEIAGLYDIHAESTEASRKMCSELSGKSGPKIYTSLDEALKDGSIDGYIIATPNYTHAAVLKEVLKAGKPVYLEKPMATTVEDAAAIVAMVRQSGVPVQVGLQYRYKAIYVEALKEAIERGSVGSLKSLSIREHRIPFLDKVDQWNKFSRYSGGTLVEKCCHYFDLFNLFAQSRPAKVYASGSQAVNYGDFSYKGERSDILDSASVIVDYENGVKASFDLCMFVPLFFEELVACGDGGRLRVFEQEDFLVDDSYTSGLELYRGELAPSFRSEPRYHGIVRALGHSGADYYVQAAFIDMLDGKYDKSPTVEEGFWSVVVGAAAEESVRTGMPVDIGAWLATKDIRV